MALTDDEPAAAPGSRRWLLPGLPAPGSRLEGSPRMTQALRGLNPLGDLDALVAQEEARGTAPP